MKLGWAIPFMFFMVFILFLGKGLFLQSTLVPSPLIGQPAPELQLSDIYTQKKVSNAIFKQHISLLNVWATWCQACAEEHAQLLTIAKDYAVQMVALDYKDNPELAKQWLKTQGNPYAYVLNYEGGNVAIDWGVYGTPETFLIDQSGIVQYKHIGPVTSEAWENELLPRIRKLQS
jgi:cytochrome c biogenesis protein CcmG/thiol:disulfide interchange protein DsbE